jgi:hypothetical protein
MMGIAGIISIAPEKNSNTSSPRIGWIKIGFDDDFQPATMMITCINTLANGSRFRKDLKEATMRGPQSAAHSRLFDNTWLRTQR